MTGVADETEIAAVARTYAITGLLIFPCWWPDPTSPSGCACPDPQCGSPAKHPLVRHGLKEASADPDVVARWWSRWPNANIGVPAHENRFAILDVDRGPGKSGDASFRRLAAAMAAHGMPLPETLTQRTGSGGWHLLFAAPPGGIKSTSNAFGPDMPHRETRGRGGYIIAAPSLHVSGGRYSWRSWLAPLAPWPAILSVFTDPPRPAASSVPRPREPIADKYVAAAFDGEIRALHAAPNGHRNTQLNTSAFALGQFVGAGVLDEGTATRELLAAGLAIGLSESECARTIRSGIESGRATPRVLEGAR